jgi:hypothetical protein
MNPSNNSGMELPPVMEQKPVPNTPVESTPNASPEQQTQPSEKAPKATAPSTGMPPSILNLPHAQPATDSATNDSSTTPSSSSSSPQFAQDKDLIDKEWVNKAKSIVERNKDDPFKQSEELTLLKADYMQKRFNKTLKLNK